MFSDIVILAGGFGERLWPASKADFPKQFMTLDGGISFLQNAIIRSLYLNPKGKIILATRDGLQDLIAKQCNELLPKLSKKNADKLQKDLVIFAEPVSKHTTAPIVASCYLAKKIDNTYSHSFLILTSDHIISPKEKFLEDVEKAYLSASKNHFVTFGIPPYAPLTGYGYILTGKEEENNKSVYKILEFKEKPDEETAQKYIDNGNCKWNSGMFGFSCDFFLSELEKCTPEVFNSFKNLDEMQNLEIEKIQNINNIKSNSLINDAYNKTPSIAIDKSVAEKTANAYVVSATFEWDDVGSWDSFEKNCKDKTTNAALIQSKNCFVYSDIPVAICGVDDITVVIKNNKALIMKKGDSSLVREAAKHFSE